MNHFCFDRSFLKFTTDHSNHTPRMQVDASCTITPCGGQSKTFYLTASCISESMYAPADLVHRPVSEFVMIASPNEEYMIIKCFALARPDLCEVHRVGHKMSTHDGNGSTVLKVEVDMAPAACAHKMEKYEEIRDATLGNRCLNGRTTFRDEDGAEVVMNYPIRICNISHDQNRWQVDTGRVLLPSRRGGEGLTVSRLSPAYIVFNDWDWAEVAILNLATAEQTALCAAQYSDIRRLATRNEIFSHNG